MARKTTDHRKKLVRDARARAKSKGLPFAITYEDIVIPELCPVLGIPLKRCLKSACDTSPTLDRIRPEEGYVPGNVVVISNLANRIKSNAEPHTIIRVGAFFTQLLT